MGILEKPISEVKSMMKKIPFVNSGACSECGYETHDSTKFNTYEASNAVELNNNNANQIDTDGYYTGEFDTDYGTGIKAEEDYEYIQEGDYQYDGKYGEEYGLGDSKMPMATADELLLIEAQTNNSTKHDGEACAPCAMSVPNEHVSQEYEAIANNDCDYCEDYQEYEPEYAPCETECAPCETECAPCEPECAPCEPEYVPCEPECAPCEPECDPCVPVCEPPKPRYRMERRTKTCYRTIKCPKKVKTRKTIKVPKCINTHRMSTRKECVPFQRNVWRKQTVTVQKRRRRCVQEPCTKTIMVPKQVCGYKYETRCKKVLCDPCEPCEPCDPCEPCEPTNICENSPASICPRKRPSGIKAALSRFFSSSKNRTRKQRCGKSKPVTTLEQFQHDHPNCRLCHMV